MTSRFVSGGTIAGQGEPSEQPPASSASAQNTGDQQWDKETAKKNTEWEAVQRDLEADRRRREEARRAQVEGGAGGGGERSLYDVLQANKAAKQAAFEEQNRLRNQFRSLDDDEIEFLDGVLDERRAEEERVKRETEERLASFRRAQKVTSPTEDLEGDGTMNEDEGAVAWGGGTKKRKRADGGGAVRGVVKGVKRRASEHEHEHDKESKVATSESTVAKAKPEGAKLDTKTATTANTNDTPKLSTATAQGTLPPAKASLEKPKPKLGLVDYGSDEDEDEDDDD
ncbi:hypothetical protein F5Y04DRAFT_96025 [Hypomontagnella monticulosa]|nr:hypothetical protein F5Y04DRAFT_96025 [Hypomontagnella monticulosa]